MAAVQHASSSRPSASSLGAILVRQPPHDRLAERGERRVPGVHLAAGRARRVVFAVIGIVLEQIDDPRATDSSSSAVAASPSASAIGLLIREQYRPALDCRAARRAGRRGVAVARRAASTRCASKPAAHGRADRRRIGFAPRRLGRRRPRRRARSPRRSSPRPCPPALLGARFGLTDNPDATGRRAHRPAVPGRHLPRRRRCCSSSSCWSSRRSARSTCRSSTATPRSSSGSTTTGDVQRQGQLEPANWTNMFTSRLFFIGVVLLGIAVVVGLDRQEAHRARPSSSATRRSLRSRRRAASCAFAVFTALRGTIINNLWWVVTVVFAVDGDRPRRRRARRPSASTRRSPSR